MADVGRGITSSKPRSARVAPAPAPAPAPPAPIPITPAEVRRIAKAVDFDITDARYFYRPHVRIPISEYVRRLRVAVEKGMDVTDIFATYQWEEPPAPIPTEEERLRRQAARDIVRATVERRNRDIQSELEDDIAQRIRWGPGEWRDEYTETLGRGVMVGNGNVCMRAIAGVSLDDIEEGRRQRALREARRVGHPVRVAPLSEPMEIPAGRQAPLSEYPPWGIYHQDMSVQNPRALPPPRGYRRGSDPGTGYGAPIRYAHMGRSFFR